MEERLQKLIARAGIASRRKAEELIVQGRVTVNGQVVRQLGAKASPGDAILVDGVAIRPEDKVYFLLNKPKHMVSSVSDDRGRETVLACFPEVRQRIFPVGRLDYESTGVLILTNDGEFANQMMHPRYHVPKIYEVAISGILSPDQIALIRKGVPLADGLTAPASLHVISANEEKQKMVFSILLREGKNREIRRMMDYFHCPVTRLDRTKYAFLDHEGLHQGEYRRLRRYEVRQLIRLSQEGEEALSPR
jgi:23S rRNA pseudouridine2605 synthase